MVAGWAWLGYLTVDHFDDDGLRMMEFSFVVSCERCCCCWKVRMAKARRRLCGG